MLRMSGKVETAESFLRHHSVQLSRSTRPSVSLEALGNLEHRQDSIIFQLYVQSHRYIHQFSPTTSSSPLMGDPGVSKVSALPHLARSSLVTRTVVQLARRLMISADVAQARLIARLNVDAGDLATTDGGDARHGDGTLTHLALAGVISRSHSSVYLVRDGTYGAARSVHLAVILGVELLDSMSVMLISRV